MKTRYITAMLVVLTATGMETQTIKSVLRLTSGDITVDNLISESSKDMQTDILSVANLLKNIIDNNDENTVYNTKSHALARLCMTLKPFKGHHHETVYDTSAQKSLDLQHGSIVIRGPDRLP